jgi:hypothetical protein
MINLEESQLEQKYQDLVNWIRENGGYINEKLKISNGLYGREIIAKEEINSNEFLFKIPKKLYLNPDNCNLNTDDRFEYREKVSICLLKETFNERSFWKPYLNLLMKIEEFENHPIVLFMNGKFPNNSERIYELAKNNYQNFINFHNKLIKYNETNKIFNFELKITFTLWSYLSVMTRMWTNVGLVPFADLLQHSNESNISLNFDSDLSSMITQNNIKKDEIVYDNYLIQDDISLYLNFGFVDSSNLSYSSINFIFERSPGFLSNIIENELNKNNFNKIFIGSEGINQSLIYFLRINMLNEKDIRNINFNDSEYYKNVISISNELRCLNKLRFRLSNLVDSNELIWAKNNINKIENLTEKDICKLILKLEFIKISIEKVILNYWISFLNDGKNSLIIQ